MSLKRTQDFFITNNIDISPKKSRFCHISFFQNKKYKNYKFFFKFHKLNLVKK